MSNLCKILENKPCNFTLPATDSGQQRRVTIDSKKDAKTGAIETTVTLVLDNLDNTYTLLDTSKGEFESPGTSHMPKFVKAFIKTQDGKPILYLLRRNNQKTLPIDLELNIGPLDLPVPGVQQSKDEELPTPPLSKPQEAKSKILTRMGTAGNIMTPIGIGLTILGGGLIWWSAIGQADAANNLNPISRQNVLDDADRTKTAGWAFLGVHLTVTAVGIGLVAAASVRKSKEQH